MSQLNLYTPGSVYWYENPYNNKVDYGNPNKNQDFLTTRPVLILQRSLDFKAFTLNSITILPISTSPRRIGIPLDMGTEFDCKILPYNICTVKKSYLREYKGHISKELMLEVESAVRFHLGMENNIPTYIKEELKNNTNLNEVIQYIDDEFIGSRYFNHRRHDNHNKNSKVRQEIIVEEKIEKPIESFNFKAPITPKTSLSKRYEGIYAALHPIDKIHLYKKGISEIQNYFKTFNMSWGTAKRLKDKLTEEIKSISQDKYCIYHIQQRLKTQKLKNITDGLKFLQIKDAQLFLLCNISDLVKLCGVTQVIIETHRTRLLSETTNKDNTRFDDSLIMINK